MKNLLGISGIAEAPVQAHEAAASGAVRDPCG